MSDLASLLRARAASGSRAGARTDSARIGLCIEGGAMRAVVAAGMMLGLKELGLTQAFDAVFGSSAGAICGAYLLSGQAAFGARIFTEDINNSRFASRRRVLTGGPVIDLDYLVDDVMVRRKPLDTTAVLTAPAPLSVLATDVATGDARLLTGFADGVELLQALRAGATMPIIAGDPYPFRGRPYFDASLSEPIPLRPAEADGCTHVLVVLTRPRGVPRDVSWFDHWFVAPRLRRVLPALADRYLARTAPYQALQDEIEAGRSRSGAVEILGLRPTFVLGKLEQQRARLLAGAASGREAVYAVLA